MFLKEAAKWAGFLAIVGLILIGIILLLLVAVMAGGALSHYSVGPFQGYVILLLYGSIGVLYFLPLLYLYRFSSNAKRAVKLNDSVAMAASLKYLKSHYKFLGILLIVLFVIYALMILLAMFGFVQNGFNFS